MKQGANNCEVRDFGGPLGTVLKPSRGILEALLGLSGRGDRYIWQENEEGGGHGGGKEEVEEEEDEAVGGGRGRVRGWGRKKETTTTSTSQP